MMRFIGGKADGQQTPLKSVTLDVDGEQYIQIQVERGLGERSASTCWLAWCPTRR
jgi:hypothetical protein